MQRPYSMSRSGTAVRASSHIVGDGHGWKLRTHLPKAACKHLVLAQQDTKQQAAASQLSSDGTEKNEGRKREKKPSSEGLQGRAALL